MNKKNMSYEEINKKYKIAKIICIVMFILMLIDILCYVTYNVKAESGYKEMNIKLSDIQLGVDDETTGLVFLQGETEVEYNYQSTYNLVGETKDWTFIDENKTRLGFVISVDSEKNVIIKYYGDNGYNELCTTGYKDYNMDVKLVYELDYNKVFVFIDSFRYYTYVVKDTILSIKGYFNYNYNYIKNQRELLEVSEETIFEEENTEISNVRYYINENTRLTISSDKNIYLNTPNRIMYLDKSCNKSGFTIVNINNKNYIQTYIKYNDEVLLRYISIYDGKLVIQRGDYSHNDYDMLKITRVINDKVYSQSKVYNIDEDAKIYYINDNNELLGKNVRTPVKRKIDSITESLNIFIVPMNKIIGYITSSNILIIVLLYLSIIIIGVTLISLRKITK